MPATPVMGPGTGSCRPSLLRPTRLERSIGTFRSTPPSAVLISTAQTQLVPSRTQGARSNHKNRPPQDCEPAGHGIGRSRGGLTTKIHSAVDGRGRPLANVVTGGQRNDGAMLAEVLADIHVPRQGRGRPRTQIGRASCREGGQVA